MSKENRYNAKAEYVSGVDEERRRAGVDQGDREERRPAIVEILPNHAVIHRIDAPLSATQHVEMRTSAVDRAKGFLIASTPLYIAFALGVVLLGVLFAGVPFWSFWAFSIFWLSFVAAWLWGYKETLDRSAEGISHYEARRKWDVIEEEQRRRWDHYERQKKL